MRCEGNGGVKAKRDLEQVTLVAYRRKREGGRRPEGIEVSLFSVLLVWIKGWELRRPLKTFFSPDAFPALPWSGSIPPLYHFWSKGAWLDLGPAFFN